MWWDSAVFELSGHEFGHALGPMRTFTWDAGKVTYRTDDVAMPSRAGRTMGRDVQDAGSWEIGLRTLVEGGEAAALAEVAHLAAVWQPPADARATTALRYHLANRWRRVYGRPRGMALPTTNILTYRGRADVSCVFDLADPLHYTDELSSVTYSGAGVTVGGLVAPLVAPLSTRRTSGSTARFVTNHGDAPTPLAIRFQGPAASPRLYSADGRIDVQIVGNLAYDESITVDARQQTIRRQDGASVPGRISPRTRLSDLHLPPGETELFFSAGADASVVVAWRDAWRSL